MLIEFPVTCFGEGDQKPPASNQGLVFLATNPILELFRGPSGIQNHLIRTRGVLIPAVPQEIPREDSGTLWEVDVGRATGGLSAQTRPHRPQPGLPLSECFLVLITLNLSQRQNCLFSTQGNPIRANLAGSLARHSPDFSEGRCFGYRSELKLCLGVKLGWREVGRGGSHRNSRPPDGPESSQEGCVPQGTTEEDLGTRGNLSFLNSLAFKVTN